MEKYRFAEWRALYVAEAGLNNVGVVILPQIRGDTTLYAEGVNYGIDEFGKPIGKYKNIVASTQLIPNSTRKQYIARATGVAEYISTGGEDISVERTVYTSMVPQGFEEFMYFTNEEKPIGPGASSLQIPFEVLATGGDNPNIWVLADTVDQGKDFYKWQYRFQ